MASTVALVTLEDYLATGYRPDREWIDGELKERNVGKWEHARVQALSGLAKTKQPGAFR